MAAGLNRPAGSFDPATALAPYQGKLNQRLAAHLLRRAGFGGTSEQIGRFAKMSPQFAAETLVHFGDTSALPQPDNVFDPRGAIAQMRQSLMGVGAMDKQEAQRDLRRQMRQSVLSMQMWWLNRMIATPNPLQEKMTLFFHGHFTTAAIQKGVWPNFVWDQNQLYRANALGNLRDLTLAVSKDPAMLLYLDNASNNKAHPNENYARELMELFTLGHGNYSEEDIRQSARAFTGYTVNRRLGEFQYNLRTHDDGSKSFLGQNGDFDGDDIVGIIYRQPACARLWATSLLNFFVYSDPEPELIDRVAALIRKNDYTLQPVMSTLLQSNLFYSDRAYRALVKSPVEFVAGTYNALGIPTIEDQTTLRALNQMGQILFYPPNVAGWPGGSNWVTSQTLIARENFVAQLVNSAGMQQSSWLDGLPMDPGQVARTIVANVLQDDAPAAADAQLVDYLNGGGTSALRNFSVENFQERTRGAAYLAMAMPAYQLG